MSIDSSFDIEFDVQKLKTFEMLLSMRETRFDFEKKETLGNRISCNRKHETIEGTETSRKTFFPKIGEQPKLKTRQYAWRDERNKIDFRKFVENG